MSDDDLLAEFVRSFALLDDLLEIDPVPAELYHSSLGRMQKWTPVRLPSERAALSELYKHLPGRFPPLYEQFVLSYRWLDVDLAPVVRLLQNPPDPSLRSLLKQITLDTALTELLLPEGFIPFGKVAGGAYDPVCFDTSRRGADGDCPIVRFEHESILCFGKIGQRWELAPSFRQLVEMVIASASDKRRT